MLEFANVGIPVVVIILAAIWNRAYDGKMEDRLTARMDSGFQRVENRLLVVEGELRSLHSMAGESKGKIEMLEKQAARK
jgi:hypothetical protein